MSGSGSGPWSWQVDVGPPVAQKVAAARLDLARALVVSPPLPGAGSRVLSPEAQREFRYQPFHQLEVAERLLNGSRDAVRDYLGHVQVTGQSGQPVHTARCATHKRHIY